MKYILSLLFGLLLIPLTFADGYVPDENHTPPNAIEEQQEHADQIQKQEEVMKNRDLPRAQSHQDALKKARLRDHKDKIFKEI